MSNNYKTMTTEQTSTTMETHFAVVLGKGHKNNWFKPINSKHYGDDTQYLYKVYNGLHYYVYYQPHIKLYNLMRTNYKLKDIIFTGDDANINYYMRVKTWEEPEGYIHEYASFSKTYKFQYNSRNHENEDLNFQYDGRDYTDAEIMKIKTLDITKIPDGYYTIAYCGDETLTSLFYDAPHLPSITEERFNETVELLLLKATLNLERNTKLIFYNKLDINCINNVLLY